MSGLQVLDRIMAMDPGAEVIVMTARDSTETAIEAIRTGACDAP
jgi:DNA-binding NtrC family response regulator